MKIKCACGCGEERNKFDKRGRARNFIYGHQMRGKHNFMFGKKHSKEAKRKISVKNKGHKHTSEAKKKMGYWKDKNLSEEHIRNVLLARKGYKHSKSTKNKIKKARANQILPLTDTKIEIKIQNFLKILGYDFFTHQYMNIEHSYQCDILIPALNLVIECDGDYWHKYPIGNKIDNIRTKELIEQGFKVLRLWERDIIVMDLKEFQKVILVIKQPK